VNARDTLRGLSIIVNNCAVQISGLLAVLDVGGDPHEQGQVAQKAADLASVALTEAEPTLRKLARTLRKAWRK
jgi:hypothetical protein